MSDLFYEARFPEHISAGAVARIRSKTAIHTSGGGQERRWKRWSQQLREWDAARGIKDAADLELVRAFHIVMDGRHAGFRFKDFSDYLAINQRVDTSAGAASFQLKKAYVAAGVTRYRNLTKPVENTLIMTLNGQEVQYVTSGSGFDAPLWGEDTYGETEHTAAQPVAPIGCCDWTTGIVTVPAWSSLTSADVLTFTVEFDCKARFASDDIEVRSRPRGKSWEWGQIMIKETR